MEEFGIFKSKHLRRAFVLRKEGRHPEALAELEKACEEGNDEGQSLFVKGDALYWGGFFLKQDFEEARRYYELSVKAGCVWAMVEVSGFYADAVASKDPYARGWCFYCGNGVEENKGLARELLLEAAIKEGNIFAMRMLGDFGSNEERFRWAEKAALAGDADSQRNLGYFYSFGWCGVEKDEKKAFEWYLKGALQRNNGCCKYVAMVYEKGKVCKKDLVKSAFYMLEARCSKYICGILAATDFDDERERLRELFVYGRGLKQDGMLLNRVRDVSSNCIRIFEESVLRTQQAVFCFVLICKKKNWLSKDTRRVICEMVWETRSDPFLWNVKL
jgi:TPR repeat protein